MKRATATAERPRVAASKGVKFATSPVLAVRLPDWRSRLVMFCLFAAFVALAAQAFRLQVVSDEFLQVKGKARYQRTIELPATRGKIMDRNGQVLAISLPVKAVWAIPEDVLKAPAAKRSQLAGLLGLAEADLHKKLKSHPTFVYLKRQVEMDVVDKVLALDIEGIGTQKEYKRYYPQGEVMAHVVGFTNVEDKGQEAMELQHQDILKGEPGSRKVIKDRLGRIVEDLGMSREPRDGQNLTLSIDSKLQYLAHQHIKEAVDKFKAKAGAAVILDVHTGEVLALSNWPTYNPNDRSRLTGEQLRNRVVTDTFEPGSTMKPMTVALALDKKVVHPEQVFITPPRMRVGSASFGDSHPKPQLTVQQIIQKSSNVGVAQIAFKMQPQDMWEIYTKAGLGQQPKFGFPGAVAGRVRPYKSWKPIETANMAFGHGLSVSLLQLARSYLIYGREGGDIIPLSFLKTDEQPVGQPVITPETARKMRTMLEMVVSPEGTASRAQVPGYRVGGKTGTAQKIVNGRYSHTKYVGSFVGIAPMSAPRFVIAVMIDEASGAAHQGGAVAAPTFSALAAAALRAANVPPDSTVTDIIIPDNPLEEAM
jgi:cell division protein FtsI (penicillin-binding protein 3)